MVLLIIGIGINENRTLPPKFCVIQDYSCHLLSLVGPSYVCLYFMKKSAKNGRFSVLGNTFQGQKLGCKDFGIP